MILTEEVMKSSKIIVALLILMLSVAFAMSDDGGQQPITPKKEAEKVTVQETPKTNQLEKNEKAETQADMNELDEMQEEKKYTITEPYDFPLKPGTKEWKEFKGNVIEQRKACEIPQQILNNMTTRSLVVSVLNYPYINDLYGYPSYEHGLGVVIRTFNGLKELLTRADAGIELIKVYELLDENKLKRLKFKEWRLKNIELLLLREEIYSNLDFAMKLELIKVLLDKQIIRKKMNLNSYTFTAKLLANIMQDANYAPYNKLIEEYDKTKENKIDRIESNNTKYSELAIDIIELSRKFFYEGEGKYERK